MGLTVTTVVPGVPVGEGVKMGIYSVAWDNSYPTGGEPLDLTADFDYIYAICIGGNGVNCWCPRPPIRIVPSYSNQACAANFPSRNVTPICNTP